MRQMKDSGFPWIGAVPENWEIRKLKHYYKMQTGFTPDTKKQEFYDDEFGFDWVNISDLQDGATITGTKKKISQLYVEQFNPDFIPKGSLMYSFKLSVGQTSFAGKPIYSNEAIASFLADDNVDLHYLRYSSIFIIENAQTNIYNAKILNQDLINNAYVPFPPLPEQHLISAYLDRQCTLIDSVIDKTKASIEEYKKLRQAVITQAVTKGVRGDRAMKDSGIEWIGEIPEEWSIVKFKYIATVKSNLVHPNEYLNYMQIAPDNIEKGNAKLLECKTVEEIGIESDNHLFYKGQIIYSKIRPILNKVIIAPFDGLCSADMYPIETSINKAFLVYMMLSERFLAQVKLVTENRVKMPKINQEELGQVLIYNAPIAEQQEIVAYLDKKCAEIDSLITKKEQFLTELDTYKKSLIYEYVTGKKEVPQA